MLRRSFLASTGLALCTQVDAQTTTPPDAASFFGPSQTTGVALSPDGLKVAIKVRVAAAREILAVITLETMAQTVVFGSDNADVGGFVWLSDSRLAFTLADIETPQGKQDAGPGLFAVNMDGSDYRQLVERQTAWLKNGNDSRKLEPWNTFLLNGAGLFNSDDVLAVRPEAISEKDYGYAKLLRINTRTTRSEEIPSPLHSVGWWPDANGELRVVLTRQGAKSTLQWNDPATKTWKILDAFDAYTGDSDLQVQHVGRDGQLYVTARRGKDKQALWLMNPATGQWSDAPLASSEHFDVNAHILARNDKVLGIRFTIDGEVTQWLDPDLKKLQQQIDAALPRTTNRISVPWRGESPWITVTTFSDTQPYQYFLFNRQTRKFTRLGAQRPDIDSKKMASMDMVRIVARDALPVPTWITYPPGQTGAKNLPMVVLVHGGPFVHGPSWQWDAEVQFLAARGYVVLQPQFRGTKGFGQAHYTAGWKQWGKAMQNDVADATKWAIEKGIADPKRIAIAGASYGGYATLMGLVRNPELYRCGVAWVGVTDLDMLHTVTWDDISSDYKKFGMPKLLGDRVADAADLKANSPLTHAGSIRQPLLLAYGEVDKRVPLVHGTTFRKAVQSANSTVDWVVYEDEGHGWVLPAHKIDFWNRTARFLDKNLAA
jgi:dipeptidyl aminopeptidase/acylaminoacyl peptidase